MKSLLSVELSLLLASLPVPMKSQEPPKQPPEQVEPPTGTPGKVLFERKEDPENQTENPAESKVEKKPEASGTVPTVSDAERNAITFTAYNLDVHLVPAESKIAVHVVMKLRNDGPDPLTHVALQISSSLHWDNVALAGAGPGGQVLRPTLAQHTIDTDADHTGRAREAVLTLPEALAPRAELELTAIYSGTITQSAERLERIGAPARQAAFSEWDVVSAQGTYLRGFGQVLWYPTASAPVFLGDGAKFFEAVGQSRLRQARASVRLRTSVEFTGEAPDAAYFCGRREQMTALSENANVPVSEAPGVAVAEFPEAFLGFRTPSLFVIDHKLVFAKGAESQVLAAATDRTDALDAYAASATRVQPLLSDWLGASPLQPLNLLDHEGEPFEDDALLVTPMRSGAAAAEMDPSMVHSLTHAWFRSRYPWMDEGLAQFMMILWTERTQGRDAALALLQSSGGALALAEPDLSVAAAERKGQSLVAASSDVYYRTKGAAVWWMLRGIVGDDALKKALQSYRRDAKTDQSAGDFEKVLERASSKDLRWFFDDWVDHDRGLPDLSITSVTPREMPAQGGKDPGWLVAVDVKNDGDAVADVPVTVRAASGSASGAGTLTKTERLRIRGRSSASTRILFESRPEEVIVNDGGVPEMRTNTHREQIVLHPR